MASPGNKVVVHLGANVQGLLAGMNEAIAAVKGSTGRISTELAEMSKASTRSSQETIAAIKASSFSMGELVTSFVSMATIWKSYSIAKQFVEMGIETNAGIQQTKFGIGSLIAAQYDLKTAAGQSLEGVAALKAGIGMAATELVLLREAASNTSATAVQLIGIYKDITAAAARSGASLSETRELTVGIAQAAGATGEEFSKATQEANGILLGQIRVKNELARNLGITAEMVKGWKEQGTLVENVLAKMAPYAAFGADLARTWTGVRARIHDATEELSASMTRPLFDRLLEGLNGFRQGFSSKSMDLGGSLAGLVEGGRTVFAAIGEAAKSALGWVQETLAGISRWLSDNRVQVASLVAAIGSLGTAAAGAFGTLLSTLASLATVGLGPLTTVIQLAANLLSSTVVQAILLAYAFSGPLSVAFRGVSALAGSILGVMQTLQVRMALAAMEARPLVTGVQALTAAEIQASAGAGGLAGALVSLINPWVVLGVAVIGTAYALERWVTAGRRAAEEQAKAAAEIRRQTDEWRSLTKELEDNDARVQSMRGPTQERADAMDRGVALIERLNILYPGFNKFLADEAGNQRSIADAIRMANQERARELNSRIASTKAQLEAAKDSAEALSKSAREARAAVEGPLGTMHFSPAPLFDAWKLSATKGQIEALTKALADLYAAKTAALGTEGPGPSATPKGTEIGDTATNQAATKQLEAWRLQLEQLKALRTNWFSWDNAQELAFWREKLGIVLAGTNAQREILSTVNRLTREIGKHGHDEEIARLHAEAAEMKGQGQARIDVLEEALAKQTEAYGAWSSQVVTAQRAVTVAIGEEADIRISALHQEADALGVSGTRRLEVLRESVTAAVEASKVELASARATYGPQQEISDREVQNTHRVIAARKALATAEGEVDKDVLRVRAQAIEVQRSYDLRSLDIERSHAEALRGQGVLTEAEYLAQLTEFENRRFEIEQDALAKLAASEESQFNLRAEAIRASLSLDGITIDQAKILNAELEALEVEHQRRMKEIRDRQGAATLEHTGALGGIADQKTDPFRSLRQGANAWKDSGGIFGSLANSLNTAIDTMAETWTMGLQKMLQGTLSFRDAVRGLWQSLGNLVAQIVLKMAAEYIAAQLKMLAVTIATKIRELFVHQTVNTAKSVSTAASGTAEIVTNAAVAASATAATEAKVNWVYALVAAAAVFAAVVAMRGSVKSAAGGMDIPAGHEPLTQLHEREMVLPAPLAERVRAITAPPSRAPGPAVVFDLSPVRDAIASMKVTLAGGIGRWETGPGAALPALARIHSPAPTSPRQIAERYRGEAADRAANLDAGSEGGDIHAHFHLGPSMDGTDVLRVLRNNETHVVRFLQELRRKGRVRQSGGRS